MTRVKYEDREQAKHLVLILKEFYLMQKIELAANDVVSTLAGNMNARSTHVHSMVCGYHQTNPNTNPTHIPYTSAMYRATTQYAIKWAIIPIGRRPEALHPTSH